MTDDGHRTLPLEGVRVLALEQAVAAPFATRQLADLGARVIKIERPGPGDFARHYDETVRGQSSYFVWLNRSKESVTLNVKHPEALPILTRLIAESDVFIQNLAPGAVARLGLDIDHLRSSFPRLIVCGISGYGATGPYRDKKAYDLLVQAEAGLVSVTGNAEVPARAGISVADIAAGMYAFSGILTALYDRERTGQGNSIEVSLFDALGEWMSQPAYYAAYGGSAPPRSGPNHATIAPYGPFRAGDGRQVFVGVQNEREWALFCEIALERPDLTRDDRFVSNTNRVANRKALEAIIEECWGSLSTSQVIERLGNAGIAYADLNSVQEFWHHPQLAARKRWHDVATPGGTIRAPLPPVIIHGVEPRMDPIPAPGAQTDAVLQSLGYASEDIGRLRREGAI